MIGRRDRLPDGLAAAIGRAEAATAGGDVLHLRIAVDYSGRDAILKAAAEAAGRGDLTRESFRRLITGEPELRDVDLIIRTSGEKRLSDFLLWEGAYAELHFTERLWPDFAAEDLAEALSSFHRRERLFGGLQPVAPEPALSAAQTNSNMRILLINPPHPSIGSRIPDEHLPPLGLLSIGGPLIDAGHDVRLLDAEFGPMPTRTSSREAVGFAPDAVLFGHSGSTSGHPIIARGRACAIARGLPDVAHRLWRRVSDLSLARDPRRRSRRSTVIVRGEGEETARRLIAALRDAAAARRHPRASPFATMAAVRDTRRHR